MSKSLFWKSIEVRIYSLVGLTLLCILGIVVVATRYLTRSLLYVTNEYAHLLADDAFMTVLTMSAIGLVILLLVYRLGRTIVEEVVALDRTMQEAVDGVRPSAEEPSTWHDELGSVSQAVKGFVENANRINLLEAEQKGSENREREFVSVVSHELRTPLTSIRGALGLAINGVGGELPEKARHLITIAHDNSLHLLSLVNDILDIDKVSVGDLLFNRKAESVNRMLSDALALNIDLANKYYVRFEFTPLPDDVLINVDVTRFQQIISNFLSNAAKYSIGGSRIEIAAQVEKASVKISVKDFGLGIPDEFRSRVFKKFSQADTSLTRRKGGTGLGLYISKQLTEHMDGQIGYLSAKGLGTTFWIQFPVTQALSDACVAIEEEKMTGSVRRY